MEHLCIRFMKHLTFLLLIFLLLQGLVVFAQTIEAGLYKTAQDFENHHLSFTTEKGKFYHINAHRFCNKQVVSIHQNKTRFNLLKDSLFGYRDTKGNDYRFYKQQVYTIVAYDKALLLYSINVLSGFKHSVTTEIYYFSRGTPGSIYPLTRFNLKRVFSDNTFFCDKLDVYFTNDEQLCAGNRTTQILLITLINNNN